jgi:hypothetical protein
MSELSPFCEQKRTWTVRNLGEAGVADRGVDLGRALVIGLTDQSHWAEQRLSYV